MSAELGRAKQEFETRMAMLAMFIDDLLYIKEGLPDNVLNIDFETQLGRLAGRTKVDQLIQLAHFVRTIESGLKSNMNRQIMTDILAISANEILHGLS